MTSNSRKYFNSIAETAKLHWKSMVIAALTLLFFYVFMISRSNGWFAWALSVPPSIVIIITAWCRVNDMSANNLGWHWQARKVGLALSGSGAAVIMVAPFTSTPLFPGWEVLIVLWGVALSWFTTPNMVPWWKYITGTVPQEGEAGKEE